jgi:hypothetical protein
VKTLRKDRIINMVGVVTAVAGALLLAAIVVPADPLGRLIGAVLGVSIAVGSVGALFRRPAFTTGSIRRDPWARPMPQVSPEGPLAVATLVRLDATACTIGDDDAPDFAPVISLTETKVARREVERRHRVAAEA